MQNRLFFSFSDRCSPSAGRLSRARAHFGARIPPGIGAHFRREVPTIRSGGCSAEGKAAPQWRPEQSQKFLRNENSLPAARGLSLVQLSPAVPRALRAKLSRAHCAPGPGSCSFARNTGMNGSYPAPGPQCRSLPPAAPPAEGSSKMSRTRALTFSCSYRSVSSGICQDSF